MPEEKNGTPPGAILNADIYSIEIEFLKAFAHNPDSSGLYVLNLNLMPSNFQASLQTRLLFSSLFTLYSENKAVTFKNAYEYLNLQTQMGKTHAEIVGSLLDDIFNLTGEAGDKPIETDVKTLIYKIKENSFKNESRKILTSAINKLNHDKGDYVNAVKKCSDSMMSLIESSNLYPKASYEVDVEAMNIDTELRTQKSGRNFPGLDTGFDYLNGVLNGIENEMYLIGGASSMGKTTFISQLAYQILKANSDVGLIFFSLDQSKKDILTKFLAEASSVPVKYLKCPSPKNEAYEQKKKDGIQLLSSLTKRMRIIDESHGEVSIKDFKNIVRKFKIEFINKPIVVAVDTIMGIRSYQKYSDMESELNDILAELKALVRTENIALIGTFNLDSRSEIARPTRESVARIPAFFYQPYVTMTLYSDAVINYETPFLEWEWGTSDVMVPIVELDILKNKMNGFKGKMFYRFFDSVAAFRECVEAENENFRAMLENIEYYEQKRGSKKVPPPAPPPPPVPNIKVSTNQDPKPNRQNSEEEII